MDTTKFHMVGWKKDFIDLPSGWMGASLLKKSDKWVGWKGWKVFVDTLEFHIDPGERTDFTEKYASSRSCWMGTLCSRSCRGRSSWTLRLMSSTRCARCLPALPAHRCACLIVGIVRRSRHECKVPSAHARIECLRDAWHSAS